MKKLIHVTFQPQGEDSSGDPWPVYYMGSLQAQGESLKTNLEYSFANGGSPNNSDRWEFPIDKKVVTKSERYQLCFSTNDIGRYSGIAQNWDSKYVRFQTNVDASRITQACGSWIKFIDGTSKKISLTVAPSQNPGDAPDLTGTNMWYITLEESSYACPMGEASIIDVRGFFEERLWWEDRMDTIANEGTVGELNILRGIYDPDHSNIFWLKFSEIDKQKKYLARITKAAVVEPYGSLPYFGYTMSVSLRPVIEKHIVNP